MTDYALMDADEMLAQNPRTYDIPSLDERQALHSGDCAKLVFVEVPTPKEGRVSERMWVKVRKIVQTPTGPSYIGLLSNTPAMVSNLKYGDEISFDPKHVVDIDPLPPRSM